MPGILGLAGTAEAIIAIAIPMLVLATVAAILGMVGMVLALLRTPKTRLLARPFGTLAALAGLAEAGLNWLFSSEGYTDPLSRHLFSLACAALPFLLGISTLLLTALPARRQNGAPRPR